MRWPAHLVATAASIRAASSSSDSPAAHGGHQIELPRGEQARAELPLGGEAHPVAVAAERFGHRRDHADAARPVEIAEPVCRRRAASGQLLERVDGVDRLDDLVLTDDLVVHPVTVGVERHELDEAHLDAAAAAVVGERDDLVVVDAALDHGVDLDRVESGLLGRLDAVEDVDELVSPGHPLELGPIERVEADVDPSQTGVTQRLGDQAHRGTVGGHRQIDGTRRPLDRRQLLDEHGQVCAYRRFTAGQSDAADAVALHEDPGESFDLLERHDLRTWQPLHALLRHAVGAAEVAAIGDRDPQVLDDAAERIDQLLVRVVTSPGHVGSLLTNPWFPETRARGTGLEQPRRFPETRARGTAIGQRSRRSRTATAAPAGTPPPSGMTANASDSAVAASWWLPCAPTGRT